MNPYTPTRYETDARALEAKIAEANRTLTAQQAAADKLALSQAEIVYATSDAFNQAADFGAVIERNKVYASQETRKSAVSFTGIAIVAVVGILIVWRYIKRKNLL